MRRIHIAVGGVVVRHEWARRRPAVERLQDRRLDLQEAAPVEELAHRLERPRARHEDRHLNVAVRQQIEVTLAMARLRVEELQIAARALRRQRLQRLREQAERVNLERLLARLRREERPARLEEVAEIDELQQVERLFADHVPLDVDLDAPRAVFDVGERRLAHVAPQHQPTVEGDVRPRRLQRVELRQRLSRRMRAMALDRIGIYVLRAQLLQLAEPRLTLV